MKRIIVTLAALLSFTAIYCQKNTSNNERLTTQFERQWSIPSVFESHKFLEVSDIKANSDANHIESYASIFLDTSIKPKKPRKVLLRPYHAMAFIAAHRPK